MNSKFMRGDNSHDIDLISSEDYPKIFIHNLRELKAKYSIIYLNSCARKLRVSTGQEGRRLMKGFENVHDILV